MKNILVALLEQQSMCRIPEYQRVLGCISVSLECCECSEEGAG